MEIGNLLKTRGFSGPSAQTCRPKLTRQARGKLDQDGPIARFSPFFSGFRVCRPQLTNLGCGGAKVDKRLK
jgi:hypothetical protein